MTLKYSTMNEYSIHDGVIHIIIKDKVMKVNEQHKDLVLNVSWSLSHGYATGRLNGKLVLCHRIITNAPKGMYVDHIYHDRLDNRDEHIRVCTGKVNSRNRKKQGGVYFNKLAKKWRAHIRVDNKSIHLGYFNTYDEALEVRLNGERHYSFGL